MKVLFQQLVHDMKASWKKSAALGVLLLFGMCFWLPQLIGVFEGKKKSRPKSPQVATAKQQTAAVPSNSVKTASKKANKTNLNKFTWENIEEMLKSDPLTRSVPVAAIASNPFQINFDLFPPPVDFEPEPDGPPKKTAEELAAELAAKLKARLTPKLPEGLVLKSTMISSKARAAFINKKLYFEGRPVEAEDGGDPYILNAIYPRKVILTRELDVYELKIERKQVGDITIKKTAAN